jgi:uncharacterized protein (UPF0332 family)
MNSCVNDNETNSKTKDFPKEMSKAIHKAYELRQMGDYRELIEFSPDQAQETLQSAEAFVRSVENYLAAKSK